MQVILYWFICFVGKYSNCCDLLDTQKENKSYIPHATAAAATTTTTKCTSFLNVHLSPYVDCWEVKCSLAALQGLQWRCCHFTVPRLGQWLSSSDALFSQEGPAGNCTPAGIAYTNMHDAIKESQHKHTQGTAGWLLSTYVHVPMTGPTTASKRLCAILCSIYILWCEFLDEWTLPLFHCHLPCGQHGQVRHLEFQLLQELVPVLG